MATNEVTRYDLDCTFGSWSMDTAVDGDYVRYEDYAELARLADDYERLCQSKDATEKDLRLKLADVTMALAFMIKQFGTCEADYTASKRLAIQKARATLEALDSL